MGISYYFMDAYAHEKSHRVRVAWGGNKSTVIGVAVYTRPTLIFIHYLLHFFK